MKRFFLTMGALFLLACAPKNEVPAPKTGKVEIVSQWVSKQPSTMIRDMVAVTFVVRNSTIRDVTIKIVCHDLEGTKFSESLPKTVSAGTEAKLVVRGMVGCPSGSCHQSLECRIEPVR